MSAAAPAAWCRCSQPREPLNRATGGTMGEVQETAGAAPSRMRSDRVRGLGYDLREGYRASWTGRGAPASTGHRRVVRIADPKPRDIRRVAPLPVIGFADGVQTSFLLRHNAHRPISLIWAAAG